MTRQLEFSITQWNAWAPSLTTESDWSTWFSQQMPAIDVTSAPELKQIPAMKRRRLSYFAKMAVQVAVNLIGDQQIPTVFASRHGDLHKTSQLLLDIAQGESLSPTQFGLSVHNAAAGQFHIYLQNFQQSNTIAAGEDTFVMGLIDAAARLHSGDSEQILYVFVDQTLPDLYQDSQFEPKMPLALGLLLSKSDRPNCRLRQQHTDSASLSKGEQVLDGIYGLVLKQPQLLGKSGWAIDYAPDDVPET